MRTTWNVLMVLLSFYWLGCAVAASLFGWQPPLAAVAVPAFIGCSAAVFPHEWKS